MMDAPRSGIGAVGGLLRDACTDTARCLRFYSRLPLPALPWEDDLHGAPDFAVLPRMLPVAGALIGLVGAAAIAAGLGLGLGPFVSAALAVLALTLVTGALHEDGLADVADGFGGGATRERRLEIMRDSRVGAFGAGALAMSLILRTACLATLAERASVAGVAAAVVLAASLSRTAGLAMFSLSPPARPDGASRAVGAPTGRTLAVASGLALVLGLGACALLPPAGVMLGAGLAVATAVLLTRLARRLIGGHTGDVAGAIQQVAEALILIALLIALPARPT
jgi:adenosylcobinamide-GDP ribazoletransferase